MTIQEPKVICEDCGHPLYLMFGRHSKKWFYGHVGLSGCFGNRPIFFATREEAEQATAVFQ